MSNWRGRRVDGTQRKRMRKIVIRKKTCCLLLRAGFTLPCSVVPLWGFSHLSALWRPDNEGLSHLLNHLRRHREVHYSTNSTWLTTQRVRLSMSLTHDAALSTAVVDQLSSWPLSNSFPQSIEEQRLRHFLPPNAQHLTPSDTRQRDVIGRVVYLKNLHRAHDIQHDTVYAQ